MIIIDFFFRNVSNDCLFTVVWLHRLKDISIHWDPIPFHQGDQGGGEIADFTPRWPGFKSRWWRRVFRGYPIPTWVLFGGLLKFSSQSIGWVPSTPFVKDRLMPKPDIFPLFYPYPSLKCRWPKMSVASSVDFIKLMVEGVTFWIVVSGMT